VTGKTCPSLFKQLERRNPNKPMHEYLCHAAARMVPSEWEATRDMYAHRGTLQYLALNGQNLGPSLVTAPRPALRFYVLVGGATAGPACSCEDHYDHRSVTIWHTFLVSSRIAAGDRLLKGPHDIRHLLWHRWQKDLARLLVRPVIWSGQSADDTLAWACSLPYILPPGSVLWAARATVPRRTRNGFLCLPRTINWRVVYEYRILGSGLVSRPASGISFKTRDDDAESDRADPEQHFAVEIQHAGRSRHAA